LGVQAVAVLVGDVEQWDPDGRRWRVVLAAARVRVDDRRRVDHGWQPHPPWCGCREGPAAYPARHDHIHIQRWQ
jgi:hypothetical protein